MNIALYCHPKREVSTFSRVDQTKEEESPKKTSTHKKSSVHPAITFLSSKPHVVLVFLLFFAIADEYSEKFAFL
jgi:hypothetical protein